MMRVLLSIMVACLFVGPAFAGLYTPDLTTALGFSNYSVSGGGGWLQTPTTDPTTYGVPMQFDVGYAGYIAPAGAVITIGAGDNAGLSGGYDGIQMTFGNDNDDTWSVQLFLKTASGTTYGGWTSIDPGTSSVLTWSTPFSFSNVQDFGFQVKGVRADAFHISADTIVPVPAAVLLGLLGLGTAGLRLRKVM